MSGVFLKWNASNRAIIPGFVCLGSVLVIILSGAEDVSMMFEQEAVKMQGIDFKYKFT